MIDARRGFMKDGNKNRLRSQDMHKIVDVFVRKTEVPRYSRLVPFEEIEKNDFNLNIPRYVDSSEPEDIHDLGAHLSGGIPERDVAALSEYWNVFPTLEARLFADGDCPGYRRAAVKAEEVRDVVLNHPEFERLSGAERWSTLWARTLAVTGEGELAPCYLQLEVTEEVGGCIGSVGSLAEPTTCRA
jgi:type I restriction enzyme M protein